MKRTRLLSTLFMLTNIILCAVLGWGGYIFYHWQEQRLSDTIEATVKNTAIRVQQDNMILNNLAGLLNDSMKDEKLSFAAGMTGNMGKMRQWFDEDEAAVQAKIEEQNRNARINKRGQEVIKVNAAFLKKRAITYEPNAVKKIHHFDSLFKKALDSSALKINYTIHRLTSHDTSYTTPYVYSTQGFIINFYDPKIFRVDYNILPAAPLMATLPYIVLCLVLLSLSSASYFLLMRSYKIQSQVALFRETLFSNITHELKTPLSSLQIILGLVGTTETPAITREHLNFANSELNRMKLLVDKIIAFGRMNHEQFDLNKTIIHADTLVKEAIAAISLQANQAGATIHYDSPDHKITIAGDRTLLINTIITLIDNAIKYNKQTPLIKINLDKTAQQVTIAIEDNGIGIAPDYHKKIFDPFFRIPTGNVHDVKGHGLGLSFAVQVTRLHEGSISVAAAATGSIFTINLPAS